MRTILLIAALVAVGVAHAAPAPPAPTPPDDRVRQREDARTFARQVHYLVGQVVASYVKPLPAEDAYAAAVAGLYQAARKPAPRDLRSQVRQAVNLANAIREKSSGDDLAKPDDDPRIALLVRLRESLGSSLSHAAALRAAARGIVSKLDEHSGLVTLEQQRRSAGLDRYCVGVGLEFADSTGLGPIKLDAVHFGGPGQRAGLRPGDVITHVDGVEVTQAPPEKLVALRAGRVIDQPTPLMPDPEPPAAVPALPASLELRYRRPGEDAERVAVVVPERFRPESVLGVRRGDDNHWDYWLDEKERLAYVRITSLSRGTSADLRTALEYLHEGKARGLVLDLRWCPGGYLRESIDCADLFLGNAVVTTEKSRGQPDMVYRSAQGDKFVDLPLVVLVNGDSVGGAELIASALQDHKRAFIIGQRTRGKGSVQVLLEVGEGVALKLTKGTFVRPGGKNLHRFAESTPADDWGVIPDEDCRISPQLSKRLREWHQGYALRPGKSNERLPLDDPQADPQRLEAFERLKKVVSTPKKATGHEVSGTVPPRPEGTGLDSAEAP